MKHDPISDALDTISPGCAYALLVAGMLVFLILSICFHGRLR